MTKKAVLVLFDDKAKQISRLYRVLHSFHQKSFVCEIWFFCRDRYKIHPYPADSLVIIEAENGAYTPEQALSVLAHLCEEKKPDVCFFENDRQGNELCARLAYRQRAVSLNNCTAIEYSAEVIKAKKPVYGENLNAVYQMALPAYFTVRAEEFESLSAEGQPQAVEQVYCLPKAGPAFKVLESVPLVQNELLGAKTIVVAGQGVKSRREVESLQKLQCTHHFGLGATRPIVQNGWLPHTGLIGATGVCVAPELLITIGVSGSGAFMAGAKFAKRIVAVNTDPDAPIFRYADRGILVDGNELIHEWVKARI